MSPIERLFAPDRLRRIAHIAIAVSLAALALRLWQQTRLGLTDGIDRPFGDDFINFWASGRLAWLGRAGDVYDGARFHDFQLGITGAPIDAYLYNYPPAMLLLMMPFAALPYVPGWALWTFGSWLAFAATIAAIWPGRHRADPWLYAAALPAVLVNAASGQNGAWSATLLGAGLLLLDRRPRLAGLLLGLLAVKPHLAMLVPLALLVSRRWVVLAWFVVGALVPALAALALFGLGPMEQFLLRMDFARRVWLEDGTGIWHRMPSVFVMIRHLPAPLWAAYAAQTAATVACAVTVVLVWRSAAAQALKNAALIGCILLSSPYVFDYDLTSGALIPLFLLAGGAPRNAPLLLASSLMVVAPALISPITNFTGLGIGCLLLLPAAWVAVARARNA